MYACNFARHKSGMFLSHKPQGVAAAALFCTTGSGESDIAFAGYSNDLTNLADARTDQSAQATAAPANVANPVNPLTCTQVTMTSMAERYCVAG